MASLTRLSSAARSLVATRAGSRGLRSPYRTGRTSSRDRIAQNANKRQVRRSTHSDNGPRRTSDQHSAQRSQQSSRPNVVRSIWERYLKLRHTKRLPCQLMWSAVTSNWTRDGAPARREIETSPSGSADHVERVPSPYQGKVEQRNLKPTARFAAESGELSNTECAVASSMLGEQGKTGVAAANGASSEREVGSMDHSLVDPTAESKAVPNIAKHKDARGAEGTGVVATATVDRFAGSGQPNADAKRMGEIVQLSDAISGPADILAFNPSKDEGDSERGTILQKTETAGDAVERPDRAEETAEPPRSEQFDDQVAQNVAEPDPGNAVEMALKPPHISGKLSAENPDVQLRGIIIHIPPTKNNVTQLRNARVLQPSEPESFDDDLTLEEGPSAGRVAAIGTKKFVTHVLRPRGIDIIDIESSIPAAETPFTHFQTAPPPFEFDVCKYYSSHKDKLHFWKAWIVPTDGVVREIRDNYAEMQQSLPRALVEAEWVDDAVRMLLKREARMIVTGADDGGQRWVPMRMREESFRPVLSGGTWEIPPIVYHDAPVDAAFTFNVRPDCSYWIWTGGFSPDVVDDLASVTSVRYGRALCPYLTVEVKKEYTRRTAARGRQQLAAAALIALFNRCRIRERAWKHDSSDFILGPFPDLCHYGLLLAGVHYEFWCFQPRYAVDSWRGCNMRKICSGELDNDAGVRNFIDWINETHRWGNTAHSNSCGSDILGCLHQERG